MISQPEFKPGDPAWVKVCRCPWWPSLVIPLEDCPVKRKPNATPIACIHFVPEDEYDVIYTKSKISPWSESHNTRLLADAMLFLKNKPEMKKLFMEALSSIEKRCEVVMPKLSKSHLKRKPQFYKAIDIERKCAEVKVLEPKPGSSLTHSSYEDRDHNHDQKERSEDRLQINPTESEPGSQEKRRKDDSDDEASSQEAKRAKTCPRKKLAHELDRIQVDDKNRCFWDPNLEEDECDRYSDNSLEPMPSSQTGTDRVDPPDTDSDTDDDDLPDVLSSCTKTEPVTEGTLLWVKVGKWPFWPAIVKNCYWKKKHLQKVTVVFIGDVPLESDNRGNIACLRYNKKNVLAFADQDKHSQLKQEGLKSRYCSLFTEAVSKAEDFLFKKCLGNASSSFAYFSEDIARALGCPDPLFLDSEDEESMNEEGTDDSIMPRLEGSSSDDDGVDTDEDILLNEPDENSDPQSPEESEKLQLQKKRRRVRGERIIEMAKTAQFKKYLLDIYHGKRSCGRHTIYTNANTHRERSAMRHYGFGPIDDEDQQMELISVLTSYMKEVSGQKELLNVAYVFDVWMPETIILAMIKVAKKPREVVEASFFKGTIRTKEEQRIQQKEMINSCKHVDPEDMEKYRAIIDRKQAELFGGTNNVSELTRASTPESH